MPQPYNLTEYFAADNFYEGATAANNLSGSVFAKMFLFGIFMLFFFALKGYDTKTAFGSASFITAVAAIFLRIMSWISDTVMFATFIIAALAYVWMKWG